ncbi:hypothetical protein OKA05_28825 [Luteolibacter arcticus]|uniref:NodB homology domain-containing protein n=1 Tax=Luteolibacter arcticus TaxID=1581411 RepID=A0ABT3GSX1_9BACT|nr:hypothetical protein [Luteolibacter arcticus]MCW1926591.1 hypothetical protein [Luteolibacter arcticus]
MDLADESPRGVAAYDVADSARGMSVLNAMYYLFKPFLPQSVRYNMRRLRANYKLQTAKDWPIMLSAGEAPFGWRGWPDGKQFAVVLTHDVEGPVGLERCHQLAEIELKHGFRSSFNLIPEGGYEVTAEFRKSITDMGFEIGVHDLRHDGSLYRSRKSFDECSVAINTHLREWRAVGFRAGFMFHNLEWLKNLEIDYDASTFDTDPFEPQPDGAGTIFPFIVKGRTPGESYVELPYTLPQDVTLYLILRQQTNVIWREKTDWLAERGGMVLANVHPDYIAFDGRKPTISEFDSALYEGYLCYVKEKYAGQYWNPLPREMSQYIASTNPNVPGSAA